MAVANQGTGLEEVIGATHESFANLDMVYPDDV
jgi:hypothetical protein